MAETFFSPACSFKKKLQVFHGPAAAEVQQDHRQLLGVPVPLSFLIPMKVSMRLRQDGADSKVHNGEKAGKG